MDFTILILYHNRIEHVIKTLANLSILDSKDIEVIIVDNKSDIDARAMLTEHIQKPDNIKYIRLDDNYGAVARNYGLMVASGEYIICLDDDVVGITKKDLCTIQRLFNDASIAAVCFKVINPEDGCICNWCHHYPKDLYSDKSFYTNEISEGAVCFRNKYLKKVGFYYNKFFISHEGPDLACRILDSGYNILYTPDIVVSHYHSDVGRTNWRRYYYDTRNTLWLCVRNYPLLTAIRRILWNNVPMLLYSIRDGYTKYWFKGVYDGIKDLPEVLKERKVVSRCTIDRIKRIESNRPAMITLIRSRLLQKKVRI